MYICVLFAYYLIKYRGKNGLVWNHYPFQFGYRAEGFEDLLELVKDKAAPYAYQTTSTTTPSSIFSELRSLSDVASKYYRAAVSKPKLTVYAKIMGEQVAVAHYDQSSLLSLISQGTPSCHHAQLSHIDIESVVLKLCEPTIAWSTELFFNSVAQSIS